MLGTAPDAPLRIVAAKRGAAGFSGGGTIFVEDSMLRRQKIDSQTAMTIAEAVAKIWLGNAVLINGEGYGVIREGLPRFIATQFIEQKYGKDIADIERLRQRTAYSAVAKRDSPLNIVSPIDDYYFASTANKGAMIWRVLAKKVGQNEFFETIRSGIEDKVLHLFELRAGFLSQKEFLDYSLRSDNRYQFDDRSAAGERRRNKSRFAKYRLDRSKCRDHRHHRQRRENYLPMSILKPKSFGEVSFKTPNKIVRVEIDNEKLYPQTDYTDDVAPREFTDSDLLLVVKRDFDKQDFANAEKNARAILKANAAF